MKRKHVYYGLGFLALVAVVGFFAGWYGEKFSYEGLTTRTSGSRAKGIKCPSGQVLGFNSNTNQFECHPYGA